MMKIYLFCEICELIRNRNVYRNVAKTLNITVCRVPKYSPHAVAEHAVGLIMTLNRKLHQAYNRVRNDNFTLDGLLGFDLHGRFVIMFVISYNTMFDHHCC
jgi:lactate dehydrogenase-like 2-hydroxyacid dehydrogenase